MEFRPCIDIHNGKVKQIVGSSVTDSSDKVTENFFLRTTLQERKFAQGSLPCARPKGFDGYL